MKKGCKTCGAYSKKSPPKTTKLGGRKMKPKKTFTTKSAK